MGLSIVTDDSPEFKNEDRKTSNITKSSVNYLLSLKENYPALQVMYNVNYSLPQIDINSALLYIEKY